MNSKTVVRVGLVIVLIWVACMVFLPVSKMFDAEEFIDKKIRFSSVTGFWWRGVVNDLTVDYRAHRIDFGQLSWQVDWRTLLSSRWCIKGITSASKEAISTRFSACYRLFENDFQIIDTVINVNAKTLAQVSGVEIAGQWLVNIDSITIKNNRLVDIYGEAVWQRAQWHNGESWFALGDILSTFDTSQQSALMINTTDINGPLQVELTTLLFTQQHQYKQQNQQWKLKGFIEPYGQLPQSLTESLEFIASKIDGKRYYVEY